MGFPTKRYAFGVNWSNWNIGMQFIDIKEFGVILTLTLLPFTAHFTIRKYKNS